MSDYLKNLQESNSLLHTLKENINLAPTTLPEEIQSSLITKIYPRYDRGKHTLKSIGKVAKDASNMQWTSANTAIRNKLKLYPIFAYGNGDYAWYSFTNGKVYDYSHDFDGFSGYLSSEHRKYQKQVHPPMTYKMWEKSILTGKHGSAIK